MRKKLLLLGDPKSGKSTFLRHHTQGIYRSCYNPTLKVETIPLIFASPNGQTIFDVLDVPGSFTDLKLLDPVDGAIIFIDLTSKERHLVTWFRLVQSIRINQQTSIPIVICGNKEDSFSKQNDDDIVTFANTEQIPYFRTSALTMYNLMKPFETLGKAFFGVDFQLYNAPLITTEEFARSAHEVVRKAPPHLTTCGSDKMIPPYLIPIWPDQLFITSLSAETSFEQHHVWNEHEEPIFALEI